MVYQEDNAEGNIPRVCTGGGKAKLFPRAVDEDKPMTVLNSIFFIDFSKKKIKQINYWQRKMKMKWLKTCLIKGLS